MATTNRRAKRAPRPKPIKVRTVPAPVKLPRVATGGYALPTDSTVSKRRRVKYRPRVTARGY